jgi:hypothetical protein
MIVPVEVSGRQYPKSGHKHKQLLNFLWVAIIQQGYDAGCYLHLEIA